MFEIRNLHVRYGAIEALHGVSLHVKKGEVVALLGANGAGKSTTLMSIMRLPPPEGPVVTGGEIAFKGVDLLKVPPHEVVARHGIALVPEGRRVFGNLTVLENLKIATYARRDQEAIAADYERVFSLFPRLSDRRRQRVDTLSGGEQQMLAMGRAFMCGADFILLDNRPWGWRRCSCRSSSRSCAGSMTKARRYSLSSRMRTSPSPMPTGPTSWKRGALSWRALPVSWRQTRRSGGPISGDRIRALIFCSRGESRRNEIHS